MTDPSGYQFPNIAFDSHGKVLPYAGTEDVEQADFAFSEKDDGRVVVNTRATCTTPIVRVLDWETPTSVPISHLPRLSGPTCWEKQYWAHEAIWTYRFAADMAKR